MASSSHYGMWHGEHHSESAMRLNAFGFWWTCGLVRWLGHYVDQLPASLAFRGPGGCAASRRSTNHMGAAPRAYLRVSIDALHAMSPGCLVVYEALYYQVSEAVSRRFSSVLPFMLDLVAT